MEPAHMARWIWRAMFGNGSMIGLPLTITKIHQNRIHLVQPADEPTCCEVVHGTSMKTSYVPHIVAHTLRSPTWALVSDVQWMQRSNSMKKYFIFGLAFL